MDQAETHTRYYFNMANNALISCCHQNNNFSYTLLCLFSELESRFTFLFFLIQKVFCNDKPQSLYDSLTFHNTVALSNRQVTKLT